jgi:DMSO/TMAO reductase YedYZ molybdopterin-dependent catalytic subunit
VVTEQSIGCSARTAARRLLVPHLYFWKSAKRVAGLRIMDHNEHGFQSRTATRPRRPLEGAAVVQRLTRSSRCAEGGATDVEGPSLER